MAVEVAMAMLQRHGRWLELLLDEMSTIFSACCLGLFGGHIDSGETTEQALLGGPSQ
jgi:8-oxo-dGTP pyrophosphatase MutT (NUDIX family)